MTIEQHIQHNNLKINYVLIASRLHCILHILKILTIKCQKLKIIINILIDNSIQFYILTCTVIL